eukprot:scaffold26931_cov132-Cylindrotheca_fusiformis.AAC.1
MQHPAEETDVVWIYSRKGKVPETVRRVKIAANITHIPDEAFRGHHQLEEVTLSSSVQVIGQYAFRGCRRLKSILYEVINDGEENEEIGIPSSVKVIDHLAFYGCTLLKRLVLNEGLERIGKFAFHICESLTEVDFPSTVQ